MANIAIRADNLGKKYRIGEKQARYKTIRESVMETMGAPLRRLRRMGKPLPSQETIWALKDVSFEMKEGEVLGIIGRNGAGKSTLLKVLSRITEPTEGRAEIYGRVGSLLEVGTGFHPELTGRENIYLNGAILGMTRAEIDRKFDEIVDFAEIEQFLDTPVKRYSSGMYVRLAFAVAAHLEPEILLVDEVLSVGDAQFQKKCMGKMGTVAKEGRTVLFVSHNMNAINRLCARTVLLDNGCIVQDGPTTEVIHHYLGSTPQELKAQNAFPECSEKDAQFLRVSVRLPDGGIVDRPLHNGEPFLIQMKTVLRRSIPDLRGAFYLRNALGEIVVFSDIRDHGNSAKLSSASIHDIQVSVPALYLIPGKYTITFGLSNASGQVDLLRDALSFEIVDLKSGRRKRPGYVQIPLEWTSSSEI